MESLFATEPLDHFETVQSNKMDDEQRLELRNILKRIVVVIASEIVNEVLQEVFNYLCENNERAVASSNSINVTEAAKEIKQLIVDCSFDVDEVAAVVNTKSWDQDKAKHFVAILQKRKIDLLYTLLTHGNNIHGETLSTFNWVLKLVLGSSELKSLKHPLLQLMLNTKTSNGQERQIMYELNKEMLNKFISVLENIE